MTLKSMLFLTFISFFLFACGNTESSDKAQKSESTETPIDVEKKLTSAEIQTAPIKEENIGTPSVQTKESLFKEEGKTKEKNASSKNNIPNKVEKTSTGPTKKLNITERTSNDVTDKTRKVEKKVTEKIEESKTKLNVTPPKKEAPAVKPKTVSHDAWNDLLTKYVTSSGKVNYKGLKKDMAALNAYLKNLEDNPVQASWSRNKKRAYWANAYNAFTIKLIVDNYPVSSITKLDGGKPWDKKWIKLGTKTYSLNNIENDILRPTYKDARVHFAVNCAAKSCPTLYNRAFTESNINSVYEKQAKKFINNKSFNAISASEVKVSKIFDWYKADFGNLIDFLNKYSDVKINKDATVSFEEYNWDLNE